MKVAYRNILIAGAVLGALGVAIGAFGAHALRPTLEANGRVDTFELAVRYQFYHALAILLLGLLSHKGNLPLGGAFAAMLGGVVLFSGSLYILALTGFTSLGLVTPFGGLLLILGWILLIRALIKSPA